MLVDIPQHRTYKNVSVIDEIIPNRDYQSDQREE